MVTGTSRLGFADQFLPMLASLRRPWRWPFLWVLLVGALSVGLEYMTADAVDWMSNIVFLQAAALFAAIGLFKMLVLSWSSVRNMKPAEREITWRVNALGLRMENAAGGATEIPWEKVKRFREYGPGFFVDLGREGVWVPKRAFGIEGQAQIASFAAGHGL